MQNIRVWLTKKGAAQSNRKIPPYTEGVLREMQTDFTQSDSLCRVEWNISDQHLKWGRYKWKSGYFTIHKPKKLKEK